MCQVYVRCSSPSLKDLQANGMSNVRHLFVETFQSAIFSVVDASGTKETLRQREVQNVVAPSDIATCGLSPFGS